MPINTIQWTPEMITSELPMREMNLTREWEIDYAQKHGIDIPVTKEKPYSIDENLWSRSIEGGELEDPSSIPPEDIFEWTSVSSDKPEVVEVGFEKGVPVSLNGEKLDGLELIERLNKLAGSYGIGRTDMIEDRVLITAHMDLEKLVLSRRELKFKKFVEEEWAELVYYGLTSDPLFDSLNAFIDKTQERVTGWVKLKLMMGGVMPVARYSPYSLYREELVSFDRFGIDQKYAEGFSVRGVQNMLFR